MIIEASASKNSDKPGQFGLEEVSWYTVWVIWAWRGQLVYNLGNLLLERSVGVQSG
jgi:hypothetical protein